MLQRQINKNIYVSSNSIKWALFYVKFLAGFHSIPDLWNLILREVCARNRHNRVCFALPILAGEQRRCRNAVRLFGGSRRIRPEIFVTIETSESPITPFEKPVMNSSCHTSRRKTLRRIRKPSVWSTKNWWRRDVFIDYYTSNIYLITIHKFDDLSWIIFSLKKNYNRVKGFDKNN